MYIKLKKETVMFYEFFMLFVIVPMFTGFFVDNCIALATIEIDESE